MLGSILRREREGRRWAPQSSPKTKRGEEHTPTAPPARRRPKKNTTTKGELNGQTYLSLFAWVTKGMEILPGETVLVYTSLQGILYNSNLLPKEQTPKKYEDLLEPKLSRSWAGKMAIPPYTSWLVELSLIWGEKRVIDY